jgi:hypothetical protein
MKKIAALAFRTKTPRVFQVAATFADQKCPV